MNKKGALTDIIVWIAVGFITILFFAGFIYGHGILTNRLININDTGIVNVSGAAQVTFQPLNAALGGLKTIAFIIIFVMWISIFISNFMVKAHPVFFIVYVLITVLAIVFTVPISNVYENLLTNEVLGSTLSGFTGSSYIMLNLPLWTAVIGLIGAIFLFIGIRRDPGAGGGVIWRNRFVYLY